MEYEDIPEVNQCQTQLHELYNDDISGCVPEFTAYRILYNVYISAKYRHGANAMHGILTDACMRGVVSDPAVAHALEVRESVESDDYHAFFRLQRDAPNMSSTMMGLLIDRMRHNGMRNICKSFRPTVSISIISNLLGFQFQTENQKKVKTVLDAMTEETEETEETKKTKEIKETKEIEEELCRVWMLQECCEDKEEEDKEDDLGISGVVFKTDLLIDSKETTSKGYFNRPYCFKVMDGDSVTEKKK